MGRAAIYARVSTDERAVSLDAQEDGARAWAHREGHAVTHVYRDADITVHPWVDTVYAGRYRVNGGAWTVIPQTLTVTGEAPLVDISSTQVAGNVDRRQMEELPLQGRNWMELAMQVKGITANAVKLRLHRARQALRTILAPRLGRP